jgi:hypothetical protein
VLTQVLTSTKRSCKMITEQSKVDINSLEYWLNVLIKRYNLSANKQSIESICININAIIEHEDFDQLADCYCCYHKMKTYWQWRLHA